MHNRTTGKAGDIFEYISLKMLIQLPSDFNGDVNQLVDGIVIDSGDSSFELNLRRRFTIFSSPNSWKFISSCDKAHSQQYYDCYDELEALLYDK